MFLLIKVRIYLATYYTMYVASYISTDVIQSLVALTWRTWSVSNSIVRSKDEFSATIVEVERIILTPCIFSAYIIVETGYCG